MQLDAFIESEFKGVNFGDKRLDDRLSQVAYQLSLNPNECINRVMEESADKKAAYRFFDNDRASTEKLFSCHQNRTASRMKDEEVILMIHDTTYFSFNSKRFTEGLGTIGGKVGNESTWGFMGHYSLAVSDKGLPLGVLNYRPWSRGKEKQWDVESQRWEEAIEETQKFKKKKQKFIHIADREADIFELLHFNNEQQFNFVIRSKHNRMNERGDYLSCHLKEFPVQKETAVYHGKLKKFVPVNIKVGTVTFDDPGPRYKKTNFVSMLRTVTVNVLEVSEVGTPVNRDPLKWVLFTNLPLSNEKEALDVLWYYRQRWHIENYFKALKGGCCRVEHCGLKSFNRLVKYIAVFSILAWRLYWIRHIEKIDRNLPAEFAYNATEIMILKKRNQKIDTKNLKVGLALRLTAKMGGFNCRKGDGDPGIISIWRGFIRLNDIVTGYELH